MRRAGLAAGVTALTALACGGWEGGRPGRGDVELVAPGRGLRERPLPLGSVEEGPEIPCEGTPPGATCRRVTVKCPGLPDKDADLAVTRTRATKKGTIFTHLGTGGEEYFHRLLLLREFGAAGFDVVQLKWESDWEQTPRHGILTAACRPATLLQHVYDTVHERSRDQAMCAIGFSAGAGALAYSLAHYGHEDILDFAVLASGPPFARMDYGCAPQTYDGPPRRLCDTLPDAPIALPKHLIDPWSHTSTCQDDEPDPDDLARWRADSVISPNGDFAYPRTRVGFYACTGRPVGVTGGAFLLSREITSDKDVSCFTDCTGEELGDAGWEQVKQDMFRSCVPRHGR